MGAKLRNNYEITRGKRKKKSFSLAILPLFATLRSSTANFLLCSRKLLRLGKKKNEFFCFALNFL